MGLKSFLFGAPKMVDNVFDKDKGLLTQVGSFIGNQQYTDQEKAQDQKELAKAVQGFAVATLGENTQRSKTRRDLAVMWFGMHVFFLKISFLAIPLDYLGIQLGQKDSFDLSPVLLEFTFNPWLCGITGGIGLFFWGSHAMRDSKWAKGE